MAAKISVYTKDEVRSVTRFLWLQHKPPVEIHRELVEVYGTNVMSVELVKKFCDEFESGRNILDETRSGNLSSSSQHAENIGTAV